MITLAEITRLKSRRAIDRLVTEQYEGNVEKLLTDISVSLNQLLQVDLKKAKRFVNGASRLYNQLPRRFYPRFLALQARYQHRSGDSKQAVQSYLRAIRRFDSQEEQALSAQTQQGLMDVYMYLGKHDLALQAGKKALAHFRRKGLTARAAQVMTNIGNIHHRLDQNRQALRYYDAARQIFVKDGGFPLALVDFNRANVFANFSELDKAERLYQQSGEFYRQQGMTVAEAQVEYSLAYLCFLKGDYTKSLASFEHALEKFEKLGDRKAAAVTQLDLAEINIYLHQFGSAVMGGTKALETLGRLGLRYEQAKAAYFVSESLHRLGDYQEATRYLKIAETLFRAENNRLWLGMIGLSKSRSLLDADKHSEAAKTAGDSLWLLKASGDARRQIDAEILLAETRLKTLGKEQAESLYRKLFPASVLSYQKYALYRLMGRHYMSESDPTVAYRYFRKAIAVVENALVNLYPDETRCFYAYGSYDTYLDAVQCLLQMGKIEESFLQHSRALATLNGRLLTEKEAQHQMPQQYLDTASKLRGALKRMSTTAEAGGVRQVSVAAMRRLEHRLLASVRRSRSYLQLSENEGVTPRISIESCIEFLPENEVVVSPLKIGDGVGVYVANREGVSYRSCSTDFATLESQVRELHFLMERSVLSPHSAATTDDAIEHYLTNLYDLLIAPLCLSGATRLIFLVDGVFAQIPFPALRSEDGRSLKDAHDLRVIVNPVELIRRRGSSAISADRTSSVFAVSSAALPMIDVESEAVSRLLHNSTLFSGEQATSDSLKRRLGEPGGVVHIAAHASRSSENPLFSRIIMSDGPFFPFDLFDFGVRAELVTLSGCQTAAPGIYYGNSFSLAKAFYQAGARYVLASLWPVSDKVSLLFMREFYRALRHSADPPAAYRSALNRAAAAGISPAFWSTFVLLGI